MVGGIRGLRGPLGDTCNDSFDLMPGYVNPGIVVLLAAIPVCLTVAVRIARTNKRTADVR